MKTININSVEHQLPNPRYATVGYTCWYYNGGEWKLGYFQQWVDQVIDDSIYMTAIIVSLVGNVQKCNEDRISFAPEKP